MPSLRKIGVFGLPLALIVAACSASTNGNVTSANQCTISADRIGQFVQVPEGSFIKGAVPIYPEETPTMRLQVASFEMQTHEVTNGQFAAFVDATGYISDAEQGVIDGRLGAGSAVFSHPVEGSQQGQPWSLDAQANWRHPAGSGSSIEGRDTHPVVHISKRDAEAFAEWAGGRLPSEIEWEYAANLGLQDPDDSLSGAYGPDGPRANTWQGIFPVVDSGEDGYQGIAPIGCFEANAIGLYDMIGNVWEWTETPFGDGTHTLKGGSFLCADNFCRRYRPAARHPQETDFSSNHIGFRIVKDIPSSSGD